ncbi:MAG: hypothetical protein JO352_12125 [Chloroflexi bacterium]|nr:hypothetical protein [Chloroflexota bacterium]MBV9602868.1 hypothetical protein [Chloroflexota bacterium]
MTEPNTSLNDGFSSFDISFVDSQRDVYYLADRAGCTTNAVPCADIVQLITPTIQITHPGRFISGRIVAVDANDGSLIGFLGLGADGKGVFAGNYNNPANPSSLGNPPSPTNPTGKGCAETPRDPRNGPNGVLTDNDGTVWVGDGNHASSVCSGPGGTFTTGSSSIVALNPKSGEVIVRLDNGGNRRADEAAFGNVGGGRILFGNPEEVAPNFPFETIISTESRKIIGKIVYDQTPPAAAGPTQVPAVGHGWDARIGDLSDPTAGGLEQSVWDPDDKVFLLNVPATKLNAGGEIDVISPNADKDGAGQILKVFPLDNCGGSGLALAGNDLIVQCGGDVRIINEKNGELIKAFADGAGADEIWFNPGDGNVYQGLIGPPVGNSAGVGVLNVASRTFLGIIPTAAGLGTHSVAADARSNRIFYPQGEGSVASGNAGNGGIAMFHKDDSEPGPGRGDDSGGDN